jgi:hypothetical protein
VEAGLRKAVGRIAEVRQICFAATHAIRGQGDRGLAEAANSLTDAWLRGAAHTRALANALVSDVLVRFAAEQASVISAALKDLARELAQTLQATSDALGFSRVHSAEDLSSAIKEMPRLDPGEFHLELRPGVLLKIGRRLSVRHTGNVLRRRIGARVSEAFSNLGSMLDAWARSTLSELHLRFETHADAYRAHLQRMSGGGRVSSAEQAALVRDLASLGEFQ